MIYFQDFFTYEKLFSPIYIKNNNKIFIFGIFPIANIEISKSFWIKPFIMFEQIYSGKIP